MARERYTTEVGVGWNTPGLAHTALRPDRLQRDPDDGVWMLRGLRGCSEIDDLDEGWGSVRVPENVD